MTTPHTDNSPKPTNLTKRWRFSLRTLFLSTALGLAIIANFVQYFANQASNNSAWTHYSRVGQELRLSRDNQQQFDGFLDDRKDRVNVSLVPTNSSQDWLWQISTPSWDKFKICFAAEGIPAEGLSQKRQFSYTIEGSTYLKISLKVKDQAIDADNAVLVACQSICHNRNPNVSLNYHPGISRVELPSQLHLWSVVGTGRRESFPAGDTIVLLRMREKPPVDRNTAQSDEEDPPCPGFMVWIEKQKP